MNLKTLAPCPQTKDVLLSVPLLFYQQEPQLGAPTRLLQLALHVSLHARLMHKQFLETAPAADVFSQRSSEDWGRDF